MIRTLVSLVLLIALAFFGTTVGCGTPHPHADAGWPWAGSEGKRTLFGHVRAIWHSEEVQDAKDGALEEGKKALDSDTGKKVKKGIHDATDDNSSSK
jgi:hypothetical protein